jgi:hypothetical protein
MRLGCWNVEQILTPAVDWLDSLIGPCGFLISHLFVVSILIFFPNFQTLNNYLCPKLTTCMIFIYCFNLCYFHLRNSYFKLSFFYFCNSFLKLSFYTLSFKFPALSRPSILLVPTSCKTTHSVSPNLNHFEKEETKQCHREFRYHQKKLTQCSKFQHPEVISLIRHCQIRTRNFYKNWPLQNNSEGRPWKRTEVAPMQTLPKSKK